MSDAIVEFSGVSKRFGEVDALCGLDFAVPKGSVVGLLGRNGAGKSTALRCLVGLLRADSGSIRVLGRQHQHLDAGMRRRIAYVSDEGVPFTTATTHQLIRLCAPLYPAWSRSLEEEMLARFHIDPRRKLKELSLGQQRAVALLLALCPQSELLVLDEPAANLDPVVRREFLETILRLVGQGDRTVIFSTHILSDVDRVADRVAIIDRGRMLVEGPLDDIKEHARRVRFIFAGPVPERIPLPGAFALRRSGREALVTVMSFDEEATRRLARALGAEAEAQVLPLDELFLDLVGDSSSDVEEGA
jgi:ABC-2 type transport system ATP-binding protein